MDTMENITASTMENIMADMEKKQALQSQPESPQEAIRTIPKHRAGKKPGRKWKMIMRISNISRIFEKKKKEVLPADREAEDK